MVLKPPFKNVGNKGVLVILDGLGDRSIASFGGKTPLEAARTPVMDELAAMGMSGLVCHLAPWTPVGTQIGCGLLLGLAPGDVDLLSRGPIEALGVGMDLANQDLAFRCNFATLAADGQTIIDRRAGRIATGNLELAEALDGMMVDDVLCRFKSATQHRLVMTLSGPDLSEQVTDTDPNASNDHMGVLPCEPLDEKDVSARRTADIVNAVLKRAQEILSDHPVNRERVAQGAPVANGILTRGGGVFRQPRNLLNKLGLNVGVVTGEDTVTGLARLFGFTSVKKASFTGDEHTDLAGKVDTALDLLTEHDLVVLHVKATDLFAHDRDPFGKRDFLERLDPYLKPLLNKDLVVAVSADHSTDSNTGRHCGEPVPSLLKGPLCRRDGLVGFSEFDCLSGGLGQITSTGFLCAFLDYMGCLSNYRSGDGGYY